MAVDYETLRDSALNDLRKYMDSLDTGRGKKLAYWIKDYSRFLSQESSFRSDKLIRYKRGAVVKVHLGYRIGSEEGGLHYAIVMDRNNSIHNPTLTVIPLTSIKPGVDLAKMPPAKVPIGAEIYTLLSTNLNAEIKSAKQQLTKIKELHAKLKEESAAAHIAEAAGMLDAFDKELDDLNKQIEYCYRMKDEVDRMKIGSIALVGQITTVSKIRVYDPKYKNDALSKIRVSASTLDILDQRVQELYGAPTK